MFFSCSEGRYGIHEYLHISIPVISFRVEETEANLRLHCIISPRESIGSMLLQMTNSLIPGEVGQN